MFTAGRRSDIALRAGEGAAELARAAGATKMDWEAAAEPAGKEGTSGQDEARKQRARLAPLGGRSAPALRAAHHALTAFLVCFLPPLQARDSLSATMPAPASHEENGDAFRSLPGGFRGFPVLRCACRWLACSGGTS